MALSQETLDAWGYDQMTVGDLLRFIRGLPKDMPVNVMGGGCLFKAEKGRTSLWLRAAPPFGQDRDVYVRQA